MKIRNLVSICLIGASIGTYCQLGYDYSHKKEIVKTISPEEYTSLLVKDITYAFYMGIINSCYWGVLNARRLKKDLDEVEINGPTELILWPYYKKGNNPA